MLCGVSLVHVYKALYLGQHVYQMCAMTSAGQHIHETLYVNTAIFWVYKTLEPCIIQSCPSVSVG